MISIVRNYTATKSPISHKYLNHGRNVPIQKYSYVKNPFSCKSLISIRTYSTHKPNNINEMSISTPSVKIYDNAYNMKKEIISENKAKSGIYM